MVSRPDSKDFQGVVMDYYRAHGRHDLPWRQLDGPDAAYKVLVSEVMLQQTQVARVVPKFLEFMQLFPSVEALAGARQAQVLKAWSGLGYNRRARYLWQAAQAVVGHYNGQLPDDQAELVKLPGIGPNTAGAIMAYAFGRSAVFIETNIRTVYIHHFFKDQQGIADKQIVELLQKTLPRNPRIWYWALMDYGSHLKQAVGNLNKLSKGYTKQSAFKGSKRQIRGQVLRLLGDHSQRASKLRQQIADDRLDDVLGDLLEDGLITRVGNSYTL